MEELILESRKKDRSNSVDSRRSSSASSTSFYSRNGQRLSISSQRELLTRNHAEEVNIIDLMSDDEGSNPVVKKEPESLKEEQKSNKSRRMSDLVNRKHRKSIFSFGSDLIHGGGSSKETHHSKTPKQHSLDAGEDEAGETPSTRRFSLISNRFHNKTTTKTKLPRKSLPNIPIQNSGMVESQKDNSNQNDNSNQKDNSNQNDNSNQKDSSNQRNNSNQITTLFCESPNNSLTLVHAKPFDLFCKVLLLGDPGVGKTCLLLKYKDGVFLSGSYISTVGIDFRNKVINVDDSTVKLQIWDTAGQERFRSVTHAYYRDAHALLLLYDVMNKASFDNTRGWLAEVKEYAQDDVVIMLIGNKCDIPASERQIRREDGERLAREYSVAFMETSAKTGLNVDLAFTAIAKDLKARKSSSVLEKKFNVAEYVVEQERIDHCTCSLI